MRASFRVRELRVFYMKEHGKYVAYAPSLDLSTCGDTKAQAKKRIAEAVKIFLQETLNGCKLLVHDQILKLLCRFMFRCHFFRANFHRLYLESYFYRESLENGWNSKVSELRPKLHASSWSSSQFFCLSSHLFALSSLSNGPNNRRASFDEGKNTA